MSLECSLVFQPPTYRYTVYAVGEGVARLVSDNITAEIEDE